MVTLKPVRASNVKHENSLYGADTNGNELIEAIHGEGGTNTIYEHAYYMADMPLLIGVHRIPPPAETP
ncbi:MAG: hypothetical protein FJ031_04000 [Chloroflexi bacterium]|nr:hypothetical protein [Chloroflexota bacterium]